jgi:hypothetical protein
MDVMRCNVLLFPLASPLLLSKIPLLGLGQCGDGSLLF